MELHGENIVGGTNSAEGAETFTAIDPHTGAAFETAFHIATESEVDRAVRLAAAAAPQYRGLSAEQRAAFLERIAEEIISLGEPLLECAHRETALPLPRLTGERGRTVGQLRMFAALLREGSWVEARIDHALPDRQPLPRPDLRRMLIPLGPVAVFGASNFPFAFSVAGGDTASALAAGCPTVVKAHPAHPGTSELVARAVGRAALVTGMPDGVFSMLHGMKATGLALVRHPGIEAVGFTGSLAAGRALCAAAAARPRPIPVYAEMGSVNPVFILPGALAERGEKIAEGLAQSVTMGVGQFCTNPGVVVGMEGEGIRAFLQAAAQRLEAAPPGTMLYPGLRMAFDEGAARLRSTSGVEALNSGRAAGEGVNAALFSTSAARFLGEPALREELFGPSSLAVVCGTPEEMESVAMGLEGQLTATVHATSEDIRRYRGLISILETRVGRLLFNAFPTGVEVSPAMQHGGPYPAASDSRSTSVGTAAILRFARPICYQDCPAELLPLELRDENPLKIWRLIDGATVQD